MEELIRKLEETTNVESVLWCSGCDHLAIFHTSGEAESVRSGPNNCQGHFATGTKDEALAALKARMAVGEHIGKAR